MQERIRAIVNEGQIEPLDDFWLKAGEPALEAIWDNSEQDVYEELLKPSLISGENYEHLRRDN